MQENMLLEKDKLLSKQKVMSLQLSINILNQITESLNLFSWPEDISMSSGNDIINSIIKKFSFHPSINTLKKEKSKLIANFRLTLYLQRP